MIVVVSKNSLTSSGQKWEIQCAREERKPMRGIWAYSADRTKLPGVSTYGWSDRNIIGFIDSLWAGAADMRKALIVGINHYDHIAGLHGCVHDARAVKEVLERHANAPRETNFTTPRLMIAEKATEAITRADLRDAVQELFADDAETALFYFSGHGYLDNTGGFLCASDCKRGDDGLSLAEVMTFVNTSPAKNKVILLDSCHSGITGSNATQSLAEIKDGVSILTASTAKQYAMEQNGSGLFTGLLVDALNGAAANLVGDITPGSVYAHIDQSLGPWKQRPVFKTNVKQFASLRKTEPPIPLEDLQNLTKHFPTPKSEFKLDPSYEPERTEEQLKDPKIPKPDPAHTAVFAVLQKYNRVNLVNPVDAPHMWHAAWYSKGCELTTTGRHYWSLVAEGLI
jgi:hypothetical protein